MSPEEMNGIKLEIWREMMHRVTRTYPTGGGGIGVQGQVYFTGQQQYASEYPAMQPLDAAKMVQQVFDAIYPPALTVTLPKLTKRKR